MLTRSLQCVQSTSNDFLDGHLWESTCKEIAESGYGCPNNVGTCFALGTAVTGSCWSFGSES